jgi:hypothetical protein
MCSKESGIEKSSTFTGASPEAAVRIVDQSERSHKAS